MSRVVIVTGAGNGLGRALAQGAVAAGDRVIGIGRNPVTLAETAAGIDPARYRSIPADVADFAAVEAAVDDVIAREGRIDAVFANAAVYPRRMIADQSVADFMATLAVNVGGVLAVCRAALPAMMRRGHGRIVVVGSFADRQPIAASAAYSASKGALHALTKAIATEVGADYPDILVNEWVPGALATEMGLPDGIAPATAAGWGLALLDLPAGGPSGELFNGQTMETPPLSIKQRIKRRLHLG